MPAHTCATCVVLLQNHWTPLFAAARYGHAEAASLLLSAGANPHTPSQGIVVQWTEMGPLVQQVRQGQGKDTVFETAYQLLAWLRYTPRREPNRCDGPAAANTNVKTALAACAIATLVTLSNMNVHSHVNPCSLPCKCRLCRTVVPPWLLQGFMGTWRLRACCLAWAAPESADLQLQVTCRSPGSPQLAICRISLVECCPLAGI